MLITLTSALLLSFVAIFVPLPTPGVPPLLAFDPQGSIGKWPGGHKPPSLILTVVVVLALASAVIGFILYARKQKESEHRATLRLRNNRSVDSDNS